MTDKTIKLTQFIIDRHSLSRKEMATLFDVTPRTVYRWLKGDCDMPTNKARAYIQLTKNGEAKVMDKAELKARLHKTLYRARAEELLRGMTDLEFSTFVDVANELMQERIAMDNPVASLELQDLMVGWD